MANHDLSIHDQGWVCRPLHELEDTAKAIYYTAKVLKDLELLFPAP